MDCFVAEFIIGPAEGGTRWLLAMTSHCATWALPILFQQLQSASSKGKHVHRR